MPFEKDDGLQASIVMLGVGVLNEPAEIEQFKALVESEVSVGGSIPLSSQTVPGETGRTFGLSKDRIVAESSSGRTSITKEYPLEGDLDRLAHVAHYALEVTAAKVDSPQAIGYNLHVVYDQGLYATAEEYIGRLFARDIPCDEGWRLVGGSGQVVFSEGPDRWSIGLQSRLQERNTTKVFLAANLHKDNPSWPGLEDMQTNLAKVWRQTGDFISRLDKWQS